MPWSTEDLKRLIEVEAQLQGVDPRLALAVATQESYLNPNARGDNGRSLGLFQLQEAAAKDAGIDPARRGEVPFNVEGGIRYLKLKLDQSGGNVSQALSRYNRGTPDYRGIGDPHYEQNVLRFYARGEARPAPAQPARQGMLQRVVNAVSPRSAEAATPQPTGRSRLEEIEAELARRDAQSPPSAPTLPSPPTARSTPEQDAAYRAWAAQQTPGGTQTTAPVSQTTPTPQTSPGTSQGPHTPSPADEQYAAGTIAQMRQRQEHPARAALAVGGGPTATPQPVTDPTALLAVGGATAPTITSSAPSRAPADLDTALERELSGTSGLLPVLTNQAGVQTGVQTGRRVGRILGPRGEAIGGILGGIIGGIGSNIVNRETGLTPPSQPLTDVKGVPIYTEDVLAAVLPPAGAAVAAAVPRLPGAARVLHERGAHMLENLGLRLRPPVAAETLFQQAGATGGPVPTTNLWRAAGQVLRAEQALQPQFRNTEVTRRAQGLLDLMRQRGGQVSITELDAYRQRLGQLIGTTTDQAELSRLRQLYAALHGDLEAAATRGSTGAAELRQAIQASRREHAMDTLTDLWSPGKGIQMDQGDIVHVYGKRIQTQFQKRLHDDALFRGSWTPEELRDIQETLRVVGRTTARAPTAGAFTTALKRGVATAGGIMTGAQSDPMTGMMTYAALETVPVLMAAAMRSTAGRAAIRAALEQGNGQLSSAGIAMITQAVRDATDQPPN